MVALDTVRYSDIGVSRWIHWKILVLHAGSYLDLTVNLGYHKDLSKFLGQPLFRRHVVKYK